MPHFGPRPKLVVQTSYSQVTTIDVAHTTSFSHLAYLCISGPSCESKEVVFILIATRVELFIWGTKMIVMTTAHSEE